MGNLDSLVQDTGFFRSLVENGSDAIISVDENSRILYANQSVERVFGYTPEELIGDPLTTIMPDRFRDAHFEALDRYLDTGERTLDWNGIELPAEHKDGHEVPLSITFEEHSYEGTRIFSGIMRDISERKAHKENLKTLQSVARDLMQIRDEDTIAERVVATAEETLGFPLVSMFLHDSAGDSLRPIAHSNAVTGLFDEIPDLAEGTLAWKAFREEEPQTYVADEDDDAPVYEPDGPIETEYVFPLDGKGCLLVSSTEQAALDERSLSLARILAANAAAALERAERETERERQRERLERFASVVSHDLRDPIQTARATTAVARAGDEDALDELDAVFDRMNELIEDVLVLAKQGQAVGDTEPAALREVAEDAWATSDGEQATLEVAGDAEISADRNRLQTLLENLVRNALEHGGADVTVRVGPLDDAGFYVEDDGPGFDGVDTDRLFDYGYSSEADNTGFGLNIVSEVAEAHGWSVTATTGVDGGARFEVETR